MPSLDDLTLEIREPPGGVGPVRVDVVAPEGHHWKAADVETTFVGQSFWVRINHQLYLHTVLAAWLNPLTGRVELTCK